MSRVGVSESPAWLAIAGIATYQVLLLALIPLRPDLDPSWHTVSEWAFGSYGWLLTIAFMSASVSYVALFIVLRSQISDVPGRVGLGVLAIGATGLAGISLFVSDPMPLRYPLSMTGTIHLISGTTQLLTLPVAALLINLSLLRRNKFWAPARTALLWTAVLPVVALIGFLTHLAVFVLPLGPNAYGPGVPIGWPARLLFLSYAIWVIGVASQAIAVQRHA